MEKDREFIGRGFHFPPQVDMTTGRFLMAEDETDIREAVYLILMTRLGERPMQPDFGCNIEDYVFDLPDSRTERKLRESVISALEKWEPRIADIDAAVDAGKISEGMLEIEISYTIRKTNNTVNMVFPYYLETGQGTWR